MARRAALLGLLVLAGCGFTPVYGPEGGGTQLLGAIALPAPGGDEAYIFNQRFEERLGRVRDTAIYDLSLQLQMTPQDIAITSTGNTTRVRLVGRAFFALKDKATGKVLHEGRTNAFTGYSTTGSTVATRAAYRDARERLMVILADQVIDDLILNAPDFTDSAS
ncbi:LPS assembly lipoprotein LptE [Sagittula sp. S175]|uniref:LPS assembly lipoprotein LptE n=1 Tax=Sagittula sp. S175 TaxID=3415129 RepID=UPI003C7C283D